MSGSPSLEGAQRRSFQRIGLVRFNPFEDTGGNQSFALALLDQAGDGFVVSSLHARAGTRVYGEGGRQGHLRVEPLRGGERGPAARARHGGSGDDRPVRPTAVTPELARPAGIVVACPRRSLPPRPPPPAPHPARRRAAGDPPREASRGARARIARADPRLGFAGACRPGRRRRPTGWTSSSPASTPEQRKAVTHRDGPLLVVAGAGTGKTQVITRRIAWLIATRRARPAEILALTFTDQAADEMQARVDQLVPYGYTDTAISTFHAFGDRLVREFALELGLPSDVRVLSRPETVVFLREHVFELGLEAYRPLGDPTKFLDALATLFSRAKDEDVSPDAYRAHAEGLATRARRGAGRGGRRGVAATEADRDAAAALGEEARRQGELARAYATYQRLLAENGAIDFGDQVSLALRLLRESPAARQLVQARFRYVLVDEFQDTNRAQSELVGLVAATHRNVTVVGDDDQSIYKFRGAAISNILEFRERYRAASVVVLRRNYRSRGPILDASYRLVRHNDPDRLEVRAGIVKKLSRSATTPGRRPCATRPSRRAPRRRTGSPPRSRAGSGRARPTRHRDPRPGQRRRGRDPAVAQPRGRPVAVLRAPRACIPAPRSGCCCRSCGRSPTSARRSTSMRSRHRTCTGSAARTSSTS